MDFYATLGDPCAKRDILDKLFRAGMTGIRVNLSHTSLDKCAPLLERLYWPAARAAGRRLWPRRERRRAGFGPGRAGGGRSAAAPRGGRRLAATMRPSGIGRFQRGAGGFF